MGDSLVDPMTDLLTTSITDPMNIFSEEKKYFLKAYCLVMTMTETKTYKKKYKYKDETQTKCFQDPLYAILFKSRGSRI